LPALFYAATTTHRGEGDRTNDRGPRRGPRPNRRDHNGDGLLGRWFRADVGRSTSFAVRATSHPRIR
jgi:hypothetical protein